ncbi:MAG: BrnT family toxin [Gammaproteobacteria bacterium]|nr:BrnT family toxin [Gammaproteobacteria bacterium]
MEFEWDPRKAKENLRKHGVDFADAVIALEDENALTIEDPGHDEPRFKTLGMGPTLNILFVVHCEQTANSIRVISARKADKKETKFYFQGLSYE